MDKDSLTVAIRIRPLRDDENGQIADVKDNGKKILLKDFKSAANATAINDRLKYREFSFDRVFDQNCTQLEIYDCIGQRIVGSFLNQKRQACIIAYGQTGSGKTHTMLGKKTDPGLIPRICEAVLDHSETEGQFSISFYEIYNGRVRDLLAFTRNLKGELEPKPLKVRQHPKTGPYVEGLSHHPLRGSEDIKIVLKLGGRARSTGPTACHPSSSRSHAVCSIQESIESVDSAEDHASDQFQRQLNLVDLAGSERPHPTASKEQTKESAFINKSLATLGNVILALSARSQFGKVIPSKFIPYRDSTLTWLLRNSLGGCAVTAMIGTISPAESCFMESLSTLRYAYRAKNIQSLPVSYYSDLALKNKHNREYLMLVDSLRAEIARLQQTLSEKGHQV